MELIKKKKYVIIPKVKNIHYSYHLSNFLAGLLKAQVSVNSKHVHFYTKFIYHVAKALELSGLISSVKIISKKNNFFFFNILQYYSFFKNKNKRLSKMIYRPNIDVYLKYINERPLISEVKVYSTPGRRLFISNYKLQKLVKFNVGSTIFLSTSTYGVIDHYKALSSGIGGLLLFKIN